MRVESREEESVRDFTGIEVRRALRRELEAVSLACTNCHFCQNECAFLETYGKPKDIADGYDPDSPRARHMPFECSLCGLCGAVCPVGVNPQRMFLQMRAEVVDRGRASLPEHSGLLGYERRGISKRYSYYALPERCSRILFPGCTLPGMRPRQTLHLLEELRRWDPSLGIVLDCCAKISHDLGREFFFRSTFEEMKSFLLEHGVREALVACPSCYRVFRTYGQDLKVKSVYEVLAELPLPRVDVVQSLVSVHDSCGVRAEQQVHAAVRKLVRDQGLDLLEMKHSGCLTLCCGEGGAVGHINATFSKRWGEIRASEAQERLLITYCAGCASFLGSRTSTVHLLDLLYDSKSALKGNPNVSSPPFTSLNRLHLKRRLKKSVKARITWERDLPNGQTGKTRDRLTRPLGRIWKPARERL